MTAGEIFAQEGATTAQFVIDPDKAPANVDQRQYSSNYGKRTFNEVRPRHLTPALAPLLPLRPPPSPLPALAAFLSRRPAALVPVALTAAAPSPPPSPLPSPPPVARAAARSAATPGCTWSHHLRYHPSRSHPRRPSRPASCAAF